MTVLPETDALGERNTKCPSCYCDTVVSLGKIPSARVFAGRALDAPISGGGLFRCSSCHLGFRDPRLSKEQLDALYREGNSDTWSVSDASVRNDWKIARRWVWNNLESGNVLDVGCFDGTFLASLGGNYQTSGIEIHTVAARRAEKAGAKIVARDLHQLNGTAALYDMVTSFDVIEHVADPRTFLSRLASCVKQNGHLIISSGNMDAWSWRLMGGRYWYCTIPEHISFVSPNWCRSVARELDLKILEVAYFSHTRASPIRKTVQFLKNVGYRIAPRFSGYLRTKGIGKMPVLNHAELRDSPPNWIASRDHFLVVFATQATVQN